LASVRALPLTLFHSTPALKLDLTNSKKPVRSALKVDTKARSWDFWGSSASLAFMRIRLQYMEPESIMPSMWEEGGWAKGHERTPMEALKACWWVY
jgi:hypothetical protein